MKRKSRPLVAGDNDAGKRIDRVLRQHFPRLALSGVYRLIRRGRVTVNGRPAAIAYRLRPGDRIEIDADLEELAREEISVRPAALPPDGGRPGRALVLFQSPDLLALNKPYDVLSQGLGSLEDFVTTNFPPVSASLSFRPGPAHRLDRNTTGIQLWSLSLAGARALTQAFRARRVIKIYCALVAGKIERPQRWEDRLERDKQTNKTMAAVSPDRPGAVAAVTSVIPLFSRAKESLVLFLPETGRTHQLRFQAARRGHALPGDCKYGGAPNRPRYFLHSLGLSAALTEIALPALIAPFDRYERDTIASLFGASALELIYERCRALLSSFDRDALVDHGGDTRDEFS